MEERAEHEAELKKEAEAFKVEFKDFLEKENVDLNDY